MTKDELNLTPNFINKNSPLAQPRGQDAYTFDAHLLDTGLNAGNVKAAGGNQTIQFNNNGTVSGNARFTFDPNGAVFTIGSTGYDGQVRSPASLFLIAQESMYLRAGTGGDHSFYIQTNGGNERLKITKEGTVIINLSGIAGAHFRVDGVSQQNLLFVESDTGTNRVGIKTNTPQADLDVFGSISMQDGNQGTGKVLVSDANGIASWQTPSFGADGTIQVNQGVGTISLVFLGGLFQGTV